MKFRRKPLEVDAFRWTGDNLREITEQLHSTIPPTHATVGDTFDQTGLNLQVWNETHGSFVTVKPGEWVVIGSLPGDYYPMSDDAVRATFELVEV